MTRAITTEATTKEITFEDYLALPESNLPTEIIDGVLVVSASPSAFHQWIVNNVNLTVTPFVKDRGLGVVIISPSDLMIQRQSKLRVRQPDLMFFSAARTGLRGVADILGVKFFEVTPELVVEVLSPDQTKETLAEKLADYAAIGVPEVWLIDPDARAVEVLALDAGHYATAGKFAQGEVLASAVLPGLDLPVASVFA
jgi:Uma2 family endonuclease